MRLTETLLAIAAVLVASSDNLATASKATITQDGLYAKLYNVQDGVVTKKMVVPLGDVEQYQESDFKQLKKTLTANQEERAAVRLPKGFDKFLNFGGICGLL